MSKYYTPKIKEFFVGFEYEAKDYLDDQDKTIIDWLPFTIINGDEIQSITDETKHDSERFRVKYLDKADIESLGFKQITDDCFSLTIGADELRLLYEDDRLVIFFADRYSDKLFKGFIKNKSELIKLLNQLIIIDGEEK